MLTSDIPPNQTVYIKNLNEKVKKEAMAESSSTPSKIEKPVIVRVKRKAHQSRVDAFWLEINERPLKRPLIDFEKLSLSDSSTSQGLVEERRSTKILVRHLETVTTSSETSVVLSSLLPNSSEALKEKNEKRRAVKTVNKQDELLLKAKRQQQVLSRNARFEQIWRSRTEKKEASALESVYDVYRVYDVVRVDVDEEEKIKMQEEKKNTDLEDCKKLSQFLPLLQEVLPNAAEEIEYDMKASSDSYVYDFYAVNDDSCLTEVDSTSYLPLVQVDDDDEFYYGPDNDSEYQTDDSNAEDNPLNDYPDEENTSEDEDEDRSSKSSEEKSEDDESETLGNESEDGESGADDDCHDDSRPEIWSDGETGGYSDYGYGDISDNEYGDEY